MAWFRTGARLVAVLAALCCAFLLASEIACESDEVIKPRVRSGTELAPRYRLNFQRVGFMKSVDGGNLVKHSMLSDPCVLFDNGVYRMWYTSARRPDSDKRVLGITYAESTDGLVWRPRVDASGEPVLLVEPTPGGWDAGGVETPTVAKGSDGKYLMLYSGDVPPKGSNSWAIGAAVSDDGLTWSKVNHPVLDASEQWERPWFEGSGSKRVRVGGVSEPSVLYDSQADVYKMWYSALGNRNSKLAFRMGYATSKDGLQWHPHGDPVLEPAEGAWDDAVISHIDVIADPRGGYDLFYFGASAKDYETGERRGATMIPGGIGHAYSPDGVNWQRDANPVLDVVPNTPEAWMVGGPSALIQDNVVKLWYFASPSPHTYKFQIGLATAPLPETP